jgi:phosphoglycolate phosphatase
MEHRNLRGWTPPENLRAILFDKDGTLVDFDRTWAPIDRAAVALAAAGDAELASRIADACGIDEATGRTRPDSLFASGNSEEIVARMVETGSPFTVAELVLQLDDLFAEGANRPVALTDLPPLMVTLRQAGFAIGIASSDNERAIRRSAEVLGIIEHISFIAGYDSGHGVKPGPGMIRGFCEAVGCSPEAVAMVGDNRHDIDMARAARAGAAIAVLSGTGTLETLGGHADVCIDSVVQLPELLGSG